MHKTLMQPLKKRYDLIILFVQVQDLSYLSYLIKIVFRLYKSLGQTSGLSMHWQTKPFMWLVCKYHLDLHKHHMCLINVKDSV